MALVAGQTGPSVLRSQLESWAELTAGVESTAGEVSVVRGPSSGWFYGGPSRGQTITGAGRERKEAALHSC